MTPEAARSQRFSAASDGRPLGTLQVDVDDLWVYYESIGRRPPAGVLPAAYHEGVPRLLDLFTRYGIRATFFVCGRDLPAQAGVVAEMVRGGHEVANHSNLHQNGYARLTRAEKQADIAAAGELIRQATGQRPTGFKAPVFSFSPDLLRVLTELGYEYDSSLWPTFYAPVLRILQRMLSGGQVDPDHYGQITNGLAPLRPYLPDPATPRRPQTPQRPSSATPISSPTGKEASSPTGKEATWEAPVTTMPILRLPMHSTFVLTVGRPLFDLGLALAKARRTPINYLLHAADVLDGPADPALASYRFLNMSWHAKRPLYEHILAALTANYEIVPTREYVARLRHHFIRYT